MESIYNSNCSASFEVIVVDNNSKDGSDIMISTSYPQVKYIFNEENLGFAKANNLGIQDAKGKYVLLLNPDTLIPEDALFLCFQEMEADMNIGALGCKLIDGGGRFLPESKRGFPTLRSAAFKMTGLSRLFPNTKFFNDYHQGHIDTNRKAEVDVLCGAMMFIRREVLNAIGGLDEQFFMYGEDIDLSYRIKNRGYKILYFPETSIVHYKGESSKKNKLAYYKMFYEAMITFVRKHYREKGTGIMFSFVLSVAILLRGGLGFIVERIKSFLHIFIDYSIAGLIFYLLSQVWAILYHGNVNHFDNRALVVNIILYSLMWVGGLYIMGNYDKRTAFKNLLAGFSFGLLGIFILYALLPLEYRTSRAMILIGGIGLLIWFMCSKLIFNFLETGKINFRKPLKKKLAIVGQKVEIEEVQQFLSASQVSFQNMGSIYSGTGHINDAFYTNNITNLVDVVRLLDINEVIFCAGSVSYKEILSWMSKLDSRISIKIAGKALYNIIGSDSSAELGEMYTIDLSYKIKQPVYQRIKRLIDISLSFVALTLTPLRFIISSGRISTLYDWFKVLIGNRSWVGYNIQDAQMDVLPKIKTGIFDVSLLLNKEVQSQKEKHSMNDYYARDYSVVQDVEVFLRSIFKQK